MPITSSNDPAPVPRPPGANVTPPLLRARYSDGYNDPEPSTTSPATGTSWTRLIASQPNLTPLESGTAETGVSEMPALMNFISLLPPPREMTYEGMERVLPAGLSPNANGKAITTTRGSFMLITHPQHIMWVIPPLVASTMPARLRFSFAH
jgi:hypothetical protein